MRDRVVMGIDPGASGALGVNGRKRVFALKQGQSPSIEWPGFVEIDGGKLRKEVEYRGRPVSRYFLPKNCSCCGMRMLQEAGNASRGHRPFCSMVCRTKQKRLDVVGNKIKKHRDSGGHHVLVKVLKHPRMDRHGNVYEHVLVAEQVVGRFLDKNERVHHINCVKDDNRPENLHVCASDSAHFKIHGSLNRCVAALLANGALRFNPATEEYEVA
jgi:hypothetical protein